LNGYVQGAVKANATHIKDIIVAQYEQFGKTVVLLGHSKGGTDASAACAMYWSELKDKVRGLIMLQSPYGGTPLAADLLSSGQFGTLNSIFLGKLASFSNPDVSFFTVITLKLHCLGRQMGSCHMYSQLGMWKFSNHWCTQ